MVIGLERNQQAEDDANQTRVRVLKNRFSGETGLATTLYYEQDTGRLNENDKSILQINTEATNDNKCPF
jgi:twinkle protein